MTRAYQNISDHLTTGDSTAQIGCHEVVDDKGPAIDHSSLSDKDPAKTNCCDASCQCSISGCSILSSALEAQPEHYSAVFIKYYHFPLSNAQASSLYRPPILV